MAAKSNLAQEFTAFTAKQTATKPTTTTGSAISTTPTKANAEALANAKPSAKNTPAGVSAGKSVNPGNSLISKIGTIFGRKDSSTTASPKSSPIIRADTPKTTQTFQQKMSGAKPISINFKTAATQTVSNPASAIALGQGPLSDYGVLQYTMDPTTQLAARTDPEKAVIVWEAANDAIYGQAANYLNRDTKAYWDTTRNQEYTDLLDYQLNQGHALKESLITQLGIPKDDNIIKYLDNTFSDMNKAKEYLRQEAERFSKISEADWDKAVAWQTATEDPDKFDANKVNGLMQELKASIVSGESVLKQQHLNQTMSDEELKEIKDRVKSAKDTLAYYDDVLNAWNTKQELDRFAADPSTTQARADELRSSIDELTSTLNKLNTQLQEASDKMEPTADIRTQIEAVQTSLTAQQTELNNIQFIQDMYIAGTDPFDLAAYDIYAREEKSKNTLENFFGEGGGLSDALNWINGATIQVLSGHLTSAVNATTAVNNFVKSIAPDYAETSRQNSNHPAAVALRQYKKLMVKYEDTHDEKYITQANELEDKWGDVWDNTSEETLDEFRTLASDMHDWAEDTIAQGMAGRDAAGQIVGGMVTSGVGMLIDSVTGGLTAMFSRSYGNSYQEAERKGLTGAKQQMYALSHAAVEVISEKIFEGPWEKIYGKGLCDAAVQGLAKTLGMGTTSLGVKFISNFLGEGAEEVIAKFMDYGIERFGFDAEKWNADDTAELWQSFLSGGLMGGLGTVGQGVDIARLGESQRAVARDLIDKGLSYASDTEAYRLASNLNSKDNITNLDLGRLVQANDMAAFDIDLKKLTNGVSARLRELGESDESADKMTKIIVNATMQGRELTKSEQRTIDNSKYGRSVLSEMNVDDIIANGDVPKWLQYLNTEKVNSRIYTQNGLQNIIADSLKSVTGNTAAETLGASYSAESGVSVKDYIEGVAQAYRTGWASRTGQITADNITSAGLEAADRNDKYTAMKALPKDLRMKAYTLGENAYGVNYQINKNQLVTIGGVVGTLVGVRSSGADTFAKIQDADGNIQEVKADQTDLGRGLSILVSEFNDISGELLDEYDPATSFRTFISEARAVRNAAFNSAQTYEQFRQTSGYQTLAPYLSDKAVKLIWETAQSSNAYKNANTARASAANTTPVSGNNIEGGTVDSGLNEDGTVKTVVLDKNSGISFAAVDSTQLKKGSKERRIFNIAEAIAKVTGLDIVFYRGDTEGARIVQGAQGQNTVYLNLNNIDGRGRALVLKTMGHELTHFIENNSKKDYAILRAFVTDKLLQKSHGSTLDDLVKQRIRLYHLDKTPAQEGETSAELSQRIYDLAMSEIVADGCEDMLANSNVFQELCEENRNLGEKIRDHLVGVLNDIKALMGEYDKNTDGFEEAKYLSQYADELQEIWDRGLKNAVLSRGVQRKAESKKSVDKAFGSARTNTKSEKRFSIRADTALEKKNIADGNAAADSLIERAQNGDDPSSLIIQNAMYRTDIGPIDFVWGEAGRDDKFKGGYGLAHIIAKHGFKVLRESINVIARATVSDRQSNNQVKDGAHRRRLYHDGHTVVLDKPTDRNHWLLTAWEDNQETVSPNATGEVRDSTGATTNAPIRTRRNGEGESVSNETISQSETKSNTPDNAAKAFRTSPTHEHADTRVGERNDSAAALTPNKPIAKTNETEYNTNTTTKKGENINGRTKEDLVGNGRAGRIVPQKSRGETLDRGITSAGALGRRNSGLNGRILKRAITAKGHGYVQLNDVTESPDNYIEALAKAKKDNKYGFSVDLQTKESLRDNGAIVFLSEDGGAGVAVEKSGNIVGVFKDSKINHTRNAVISLITNAVALGGRRLDCFVDPQSADSLGVKYSRLGFVPVARMNFDKSIWQEDHPGEIWDDSLMKDPYVVWYKAAELDPVKMLDEHYIWYGPTLEQYVPIIENYDEAVAMADRLCAEDFIRDSDGETYTRSEFAEMARNISEEGAELTDEQIDAEFNKLLEFVKTEGVFKKSDLKFSLVSPSAELAQQAAYDIKRIGHGQRPAVLNKTGQSISTNSINRIISDVNGKSNTIEDTLDKNYLAAVNIGNLSDARPYLETMAKKKGLSDAQIKTLDLVKYDTKGNIIPPSDRFSIVQNTELTPEEQWRQDNEAFENINSAILGQSTIPETLREGEPAAAPTPAPAGARTDAHVGETQVPGRQKQSKFASNTLEGMNIWDEIGGRENTMDRNGEFLYNEVTERESMEAARQRLEADWGYWERDLMGEYTSPTADREWTGKDLDTAMAIFRQKRIDAKRNQDQSLTPKERYADVDAWLQRIREKATGVGQLMQAFAKYSRTPEGALIQAGRDLASNNKLTKDQRNEILNKMIDFAMTLDALREAGDTGDNSSLIELIKQQAEMRGTPVSQRIENGLRKEQYQYLYDVALTQLAQIAADYRPNSVGKKLSTYQTIAHLLNLRTGTRNVVANMAFRTVDRIANMIAAPMDALVGKITGNRTVGWKQLGRLSSEVRETEHERGRRASIEASLDVDPYNGKDKYGTSRRTWKMKDGPGARVMSTLEKWMAYELNVTDEISKGIILGEVMESLSPFIENNLLSEDEAIAMAKQEMLYRTFQDDNWTNGLLGAIKNALNVIGTGSTNGKMIGSLPVHDFGLGDIVTKYVQVPGSLIMRMIEYSPVGTIKAVADMANIFTAYNQLSRSNTLEGAKQAVADLRQQLAEAKAAGADTTELKAQLKEATSNYKDVKSRTGDIRAKAFLKDQGQYTKSKVAINNEQARMNALQAQRRAMLQLGRSLTGSGLIALFAALAKAGLLRRDDDDEDKDIRALNTSAGLSGTQLNLSALMRAASGETNWSEWLDGDKLMDIGFLEPLNGLMTIGAIVAKNNDNLISRDTMNDTLAGLMENIAELPVMQTLGTIQSSIQNLQYDAESENATQSIAKDVMSVAIDVARSSASGFIPAPVRQAAQATDEYARDMYQGDTGAEKFVDSLKSSIPGLRQTLPQKLDNFGNPRTTEADPFMRAMNAFVNPGNLRTYRSADLTNELNRLYDATGKSGILPKRYAPYSINEGPGYQLTADEKRVYQITRGQTADNLLRDLFSSQAYQTATDEQRAEWAKDVVSYADYVAKQEFLNNRNYLDEKGEGYSSRAKEEMKEALAKGVPLDTYLKYVDAIDRRYTVATYDYEARNETLEAEYRAGDINDEQFIQLYDYTTNSSDTTPEKLTAASEAGIAPPDYLVYKAEINDNPDFNRTKANYGKNYDTANKKAVSEYIWSVAKTDEQAKILWLLRYKESTINKLYQYKPKS